MRQKRTRKRRERRFGRLPVSCLAKNEAQFVTHDSPAFAARIAAKRSELGQEPGSCEWVPAP